MEGPPEGEAPAAALAAVLKHSSALPSESAQVRGYDFNRGVDYHAMLEAFGTTGFQATNFGRAVHQINAMIEKKLEPLPEDEDQHEDLTQSRRPLTGCTIFLGYTSNLISSGIRETIRYLVQHNMVDVLVTTAGGVEEDLIKCLAPTYLGEFSLRGKELRENGINRIGNLLVPNDNYCKFEDWLMPILDQMVLEQNTEGVKWTPSKMIARLGKEINNPESVYYWAQKRNGADYAVYINTAQEFDGSDSGARPDEAVSWGKIKMDAEPVKVYADASLVFPLLVAETFAQKVNAFTPEKNKD
ncbi:deoxyhypusine synthase isoform X3 [Eptesicus fuscus]|uniref:deoxyhypusine synthase isoform X3 n=1 Tax=Eptesicus fuscus TaxID=29078 RepID=UPI00240471EA|nr:deoxyhypusine synthase isoform X3 [Eptesicus fuscus]